MCKRQMRLFACTPGHAPCTEPPICTATCAARFLQSGFGFLCGSAFSRGSPQLVGHSVNYMTFVEDGGDECLSCVCVCVGRRKQLNNFLRGKTVYVLVHRRRQNAIPLTFSPVKIQLKIHRFQLLFTSPPPLPPHTATLDQRRNATGSDKVNTVDAHIVTGGH